MTWTLGVDFGTSNTAAAYRANGGPAQPVRLSDQAEQMPSAILALDSGIMVGGAAVRSARLDPQRFEPSPKRRLGEGEILLGAREWPVTQLIAEVLNHVKQKAMWVAGGQPPQELILTYPQQWAQGRKESLRQAAALAGFDPATVRLVTEPIAAATWYASTQPVPAGKCVAVFDFGGGTCDVAVLQSSPDAPGTFTVLAADGVDPLGGELLDLRLLEWTLGQLADGGNRAMVDALSAPENLGAMLTLKEQVRHAKHELAEYESARIPVAVGSIQTVVTITSAEFDKVVGGDIDEAVKLTRRALVASGVAPADLHALYLTGGSSHLRLVHRKITELLGRPPATLNDPKLVVAQGALLVPPTALEQGGQAAAAPRPAPQMPTGPIAAPRPMPAPVPPSGSTGPVPTLGPQRGQQPGNQPPTQPVNQLPQNQPPNYPGQNFPGPNQPPPGGFGGYQGPPNQPRPVAPQPPYLPPGNGGPQGYPPRPQPPKPKPKPKWLIPAIAAAVVAIIAVVVVLVTNRSGEVAGPQTPGSTGATTPGDPTTQTGPTQGQYQYCDNGTTVAPDAQCPTTTPPAQITCWDDTVVDEGAACPVLTGQAALMWVFTAPADWKLSCEPNTKGNSDNEKEVYKCSTDKLPNTLMYLSRWTSSADAKAEFTNLYGQPTDFTIKDDDGTGPAGLQWENQVDSTSTPGTKVGVGVTLYNDSPFSILAFFSEPDGAGKTDRDLWTSDQLYQLPSSIKSLGTLPTS